MSPTRVVLEADGFATFVVGAIFGALFSRRRNLHHYHHQEGERENWVPAHRGSENKTVSTSSPGVENRAIATASNVETN
ncbi:hypothetical protein M0R45_034798 [Rubus argutus]|uniref:Uncharacterized protein n=1 Tax=Rubus argutus TaxID=59490 RepID=A0AAW1VTP0_RUBAR